MPKKLPSYYVLRCSNCDFCFGKHIKSKLSCPKCGEIQTSPKILGRTNNTEDLQKLVSKNNMPEELWNEFENVKKVELDSVSSEDLIKKIPGILQESSNSEGIIFLATLKNTLKIKKVPINFEKIIQIGEVEGLLLRISDEKWRLLG